MGYSNLPRDHSLVKSIAWGVNSDEICIIYENGGFHYRGIPTALAEEIKKSHRKSVIEHVSMVSSEDGHHFWCGSDGFMQLMKRLLKKKTVTFVDFGRDESFIIRYR